MIFHISIRLLYKPIKKVPKICPWRRSFDFRPHPHIPHIINGRPLSVGTCCFSSFYSQVLTTQALPFKTSVEQSEFGQVKRVMNYNTFWNKTTGTTSDFVFAKKGTKVQSQMFQWNILCFSTALSFSQFFVLPEQWIHPDMVLAWQPALKKRIFVQVLLSTWCDVSSC